MNKVKKFIRRVTIYGKNEEREKAMKWIEDNNYSITYVGPKPKSSGRIYTDRFKIIAEYDMTHGFDEY